ncbi:MAG: hypothetical protein R6U43_08680 [Candidatus Krumholzibacteriales bacterium]
MRGIFLCLTAAALMAASPPAGGAGENPVVIDHNSAHISSIPDSVLDLAQDSLKYHYAHTSHGGQLRDGLYVLENNDPRYAFAYLNNQLPQEEGSLCIFNGQQTDTYITPELYWYTEGGMDETRAVLSANSALNISMWAWCGELDYYTEGQVRAYLDSLSVLESEFPGVTFVYMTGNAQGTGAGGHNRYLRNQQIRQFCLDNNKVLYDFADLDCWYYNSVSGEWEFSTYSYEGTDVPVEHPQFSGDETSHTTWESCEQKGKAVWYMSAALAGWSDPTSADGASWGEVKSMFREAGRDSS